ncbi:MAG: branched-chain amino acid transport system permease protein, partial [Frankiaceae bacterium]|nr:branched-chain amino acid transport system permease protein [Frankiaceae bacterium]
MNPVQRTVHEARTRLQNLIGASGRWLLLGAAVVVAVGGFLPWTRSGVGFTTPIAGNLSTAGLGGPRLYVLLLAILAVAGVTPLKGRRRAAMAAGVCSLIITLFLLYKIWKSGGGGGAVGIGVWVTLIGSLLLVAAADTVPVTERLQLPAFPALVDLAFVVVVIGALLAAVVIGLGIEDEKQFLAFAVFVGALAAALGAFGVTQAFSTAFDRFRYFGYLLSLAAAVAFPFTQDGNAVWMAVGARIGVLAAAAIGLNVVVGLAGLLDLGYIAFFGIGGYVSALLSNAIFTTVHVHVPFILVIPLGALAAAFFGVLVGAPTLRLRGDYLAIVTLGFGEIFRIVAINWTGLTQGPNGISGIPDLVLPGGYDFGKPHTAFGVLLPYQSNYYFLDIVLIALVMLTFARLNDSRIGRAWVAIREDELAARAMGINTVALKLLAFGIGATLAGTAGTVNAHIGGAVEPNAYQFIASALLLAAVVLGGMGTVAGSLLGAALLLGIPEKLRFLQDWRL